MKLTMLGTGNAMVTECYNTCFVIQDENQYFLIDAGGGNAILKQLKDAKIDWRQIKDIFITHKHIDHIIGCIWMLRMVCQHMRQGEYEGEVRIYGHEEVIKILHQMANTFLQKKEIGFIGSRVHLIVVEDGEQKNIIGHNVTFFDIHSTKAKQFGFALDYADQKRLTCCGDEPFNETEEQYLDGCTWLMHEAFCLDEEANVFHPYEKHHSTAKDACQMAEQYQIPNLILYHTEDHSMQNRKERYLQEGRTYYHGNLFVPEDLENIIL